MAEEVFLDGFIDELRREVSNLEKISIEEEMTPIYLSYWISFRESSSGDYTVVSCDGSIKRSPLTYNLNAVYGRAVAHVYDEDGEVVVSNKVRIREGRFEYRLVMKLAELDALYKAVEKAVEKDDKNIYVLYDGVFYISYRHNLMWLDANKDLFAEVVNRLSDLIEYSMENGVRLIGISKDSRVRYLRSRIMVNELSKHFHLPLDARKHRSPGKIRSRLMSLGYDLSSVEYIMKDSINPVSDAELYSLIVDEPGYTKPLLLASTTVYRNISNLDWWSSIFRKTLESHGYDDELDALDRLYSLTPPAHVVWLPPEGRYAFRLDIPSYIFGYDKRWGDLGEDVFIEEDRYKDVLEDVLSFINYRTPDPLYQGPLIDVDEVVRLKNREYTDIYEPYIVDFIREAGIPVSLRRRRWRDIYLERG